MSNSETPEKPSFAENLSKILFFYRDSDSWMFVILLGIPYAVIAILTGLKNEWSFWLTTLAVVTAPWVILTAFMVFFYFWPPLKLIWERYYALVNELFEQAEREKKAGNIVHSWAYILVGIIVSVPLIALIAGAAYRYAN